MGNPSGVENLTSFKSKKICRRLPLPLPRPQCFNSNSYLSPLPANRNCNRRSRSRDERAAMPQRKAKLLKGEVQRENIIREDLSNGRARYPIPVINDVDDERLPTNYTYTEKCKEREEIP